MGGVALPPWCGWPETTQPWGLGLCGRLMVNFKRIYAKGDLSVPHYHGPIHASREGPPTLAGRFGSVSYRVTAPLFWVLVHAKFCLCPPRLEHLFPPVLSVQFISVQFSRSVMSNSLQPHESQHARLPCPSPTPGVHSDSCPSSQ